MTTFKRINTTKPRKTKSAKADEAMLYDICQKRMSLSGARVNIFRLKDISEAAERAWALTDDGRPREERIALVTAAVDAKIADVREN